MANLLFTGASGFLGNNILPIVSHQFSVVHTLGLTDKDYIKVNLAKEIPSLTEHYDVVLHACGKAHTVPRTEAEKQVFFDVNYQGTVNLCKALENSSKQLPKALIFISTVAVYGCDYGTLIDENHPREGSSPYALSKIMAEDYLANWCKKNNVTLSILRPSLLAGHNAPGNLGAMVNGIKSGRYLNIEHGSARKSVLMAKDIANLVPIVASVGGTYNVCDSYNPSFGELSTLIADQLGKKNPISIPYNLAQVLAKFGDSISFFPFNSARLKKMTQSLTFSNKKIRETLHWEPLDVISNYKI